MRLVQAPTGPPQGSFAPTCAMALQPKGPSWVTGTNTAVLPPKTATQEVWVLQLQGAHAPGVLVQTPGPRCKGLWSCSLGRTATLSHVGGGF